MPAASPVAESIFRILSLAASILLAACASPGPPPVTHGPFVGHVDAEQAFVWARCAEAGPVELRITDPSTGVTLRAAGEASRDRDYCVSLGCRGLGPGRRYRYELRRGESLLAGGEECAFTTPPAPGTPARVRLAFGSCAHDGRFPRQPVWTRMKAEGVEGVVLLGDTPYIDTTDLAVQRRRYGELYAVPEILPLLRGVPFWGTWDDHDFGANDTDGRLPGKGNSRRAFLEYHAPASAGRGEAGIYTSFRFGPVEVFLLDTRWFAGTAPSFVDPGAPTALGKEQWEWLKDGLKSSTATFKVLASGMVWNGAVRLLKSDHWMTYPHEREAVFRFIGRERIPGVLLIGGDIHRCRASRFRVADLAGYDLTEIISSPLANTTMAVAKVPSPEVIADGEDEHSFLLLTADTTVDPPTLTGRCLTAGGRELFAVALDLHQLTPR